MGREHSRTRVRAPLASQGHVPYELRERHPHGALFETHDASHTTHAESARAACAAANGVHDLASVRGGRMLVAPQSADELLQRLPASVVRDGRLLPIRSELAEMIRKPAACAGAHDRDSASASALDRDAVREARLRRFGGKS